MLLAKATERTLLLKRLCFCSAFNLSFCEVPAVFVSYEFDTIEFFEGSLSAKVNRVVGQERFEEEEVKDSVVVDDGIVRIRSEVLIDYENIMSKLYEFVVVEIRDPNTFEILCRKALLNPEQPFPLATTPAQLLRCTLCRYYYYYYSAEPDYCPVCGNSCDVVNYLLLDPEVEVSTYCSVVRLPDSSCIDVFDETLVSEPSPFAVSDEYRLYYDPSIELDSVSSGSYTDDVGCLELDLEDLVLEGRSRAGDILRNVAMAVANRVAGVTPRMREGSVRTRAREVDVKSFLTSVVDVADDFTQFNVLMSLLSDRKYHLAAGHAISLFRKKMGYYRSTVFGRADNGTILSGLPFDVFPLYKAMLSGDFDVVAGFFNRSCEELERENSSEEEKVDYGDMSLENEPINIMRTPIFADLLRIFSLISTGPLALRFPEKMVEIVTNCVRHLTDFISVGDLATAVAKFFRMFWGMIHEFMESFDFTVFLREGGIHTFIPRCYEMVASDFVGPKRRFSTINEYLEAMQKLSQEGDRLRKKYKSEFTNSHGVAYSALVKRMATISLRLNSAATRERQPYSIIMNGLPGGGKTTALRELTQAVIAMDDKRAHTGGLATTDIYDVPVGDAYWNNCTAPYCLNFNDLPADGYNLTQVNMAQMLQVAVDIVPFWTPQASIEDKDNNVIDPKIVGLLTNATVLDFSLWGSDHSRLLRRYRRVWTVAYPPEYYEDDIPLSGDYLGKLKPQYEDMEFRPSMAPRMRYFQAKLAHNAGRIFIYREGHQPIVGYDNFMLHLKKDFVEWKNEVVVKPNHADCCKFLTPNSLHTGACLPGCDWVPEIPEPIVEKVIVSHEVRMIDRIVENVEHEVSVVTEGWGCIPDLSVLRESVAQASEMNTHMRGIHEAFLEVKSMFSKMLPVVGGFIVAYGAYAGIKAISKNISVKKEETKENAASEGILNPISPEFDFNFVSKYGVRTPVPPQIAQPNGWVDVGRMHVFLSKVSNTTSSSDLQVLVDTNQVQISDLKGEYPAYAFFIMPEIFVMNHHCYLRIRERGENWKMVREGLSFRLEGDFSRVYDVLADRDLVFIRCSAGPFRDVTKHFPKSVGERCEMILQGVVYPGQVAHISFRGKTLLGLTYPPVTENGHCGLMTMVKINDKQSMLAGIHFGKAFKMTKSAATLIFDKDIEAAVDFLKPRVKGVLVPSVVTEGSLKPLHGKSPFRLPYPVSAAILGTDSLNNKHGKSTLEKTKLHDVVAPYVEEPKLPAPVQTDGAMIDGIWHSPEMHKLKGMTVDMEAGYSYPDLVWAAEDYMRDMPIGDFHVTDFNTAIKGVPGDPLMKGINWKSSMGAYGHHYSSRYDLFDGTVVEGAFKDKVEKIARVFEENVVANPEKWCRKVELLTKKKVDMLKARIFMGGDPDYLTFCRMFLSTGVAHLYRNRDFFECQGAFNPASPDFGKSYHEMRKFVYLVLGDISHMDSSYRAAICEAVAYMAEEMWLRNGATSSHAKCAANIFYSACFSIVRLGGDIAFFTEGLGSGRFITFLINCWVISLLYRVAWKRLFPEGAAPVFRSSNKLITGGDDSANATNHPGFGAVHLSKVFAQYGFVLSPPTNKDGILDDFYPWEEFVFLKRSPKDIVYYSQSRGSIVSVTVGALAKDSLYKPCMYWDKENGITECDRMSQALNAQVREAALHGKEFFDFFVNLIEGPYAYKHMTYDDVIENYVLRGLYCDIVPERDTTDLDLENVRPVEVGKDTTLDDGDMVLEGFMSNFALGVVVTTSRTSDVYAFLLFPVLVFLLLKICFSTFCCLWLVAAINFALALPVSKSLAAPHAAVESRVSNSGGFEHERRLLLFSFQTNSSTETTETQSVIGNTAKSFMPNLTTTFDMSSDLLSGSKPTYYPSVYALPMNDVTLKESLSRPVLVNTFSWTSSTSATPTSVVECYGAWFADAFISRKLYGYRFFRGKPKLLFVVQGQPFSYGRLLMAADYYPGVQPVSNAGSNGISMVSVSQAFQAPHVAIDPGVTNTYELPLKFYSTTGWWDRFNVSGQPTLTVYSSALSLLSTAQAGAVPTVTVKVYFIMEDVELSVPALGALEGPDGEELADEDLILEGVGDEAKPTGTISGPLTVAAGAAGWLGSTFPVLAPYTTPFSFVSSAAANILSFFGYSRPVVLEEHRFQFQPADSVSYMHGRAAIDKLTADPKQGVAFTADAPGVGDDDDMSLAKLFAREGICGKVSWSTSNVMTGDTTVVVAPNLGYDSVFSPLGFFSTPFRYWTGTIVFRIQVIASPFHRGVFAISYLPYTTPTSPNTTWVTNFMTKIVDLSATREVVFEVPYCAAYPWLENFSATGLRNNGQISIYPINPLLSNGGVNPVDIVIYCRAGDDFDVARPGQFVCRYSTPGFAPNGNYSATAAPAFAPGLLLADDVKLEGPADEVDQVDEMGSIEHQQLIARQGKGNSSIFFGEKFTSLKELCNRYVVIYRERQASVQSSPIIITLPNQPMNAFAGNSTVAGNSVFTTSYSSYFRSAFLAERGGVRYKVIPIDDYASTDFPSYAGPSGSYCSVVPIVGENTNPYFTQSAVSNTASWGSQYRSTGGGCLLTNNDTKMGAEFEFPDVDTCRFRNPREFLVVSGNGYAPGNMERPCVTMGFSTVGGRQKLIEIWQAVGDDYSLHGFQYVPKYTFVTLT